MKASRCRWTRGALGIVVCIAAWTRVNCDPAPPDWLDGIANNNILYTEHEGSAYLPVLSNGYLAHTIGEDSVYVSGVFNGNTSTSRRASIPASIGINVAPGRNGELHLKGAGLDILNATYTRLGRVTEAGSTVDFEQTWFAHRLLRSVLTMRLRLIYTPGATSQPVTLLLNGTRAAKSDDLNFQDLSDAHPGLQVLLGKTREAETAETPLPEVALVSTPVPSSLQVTANRTLDFVVSVRTSLDPVGTYGPVLDAALNDHKMARRMAPSGELYLVHIVAWRSLWASGFEIKGRPDVAVAANASFFSLLSSVRSDWSYGLGPGGLTNAYRGHSFWDSETWMFPPLLHWQPNVARGLLRYRYERLGAAYAKAKSHNPPYNGAMFPWESASSGLEVCDPSMPMGLREQHISGDVALATWQYWQSTHDVDWLRATGYPLLRGIADFWASRAAFSADGSAHIADVIPPDEYVDHVSDSAFTNVAAKRSLEVAGKAAGLLGETPDPQWAEVREALVVPFDQQLGIHPEYDGYQGQRIKQADVVLLPYPLGWPVDEATRERDLHYYAERTDEDGPAMTWAMHAIGYNDLGQGAEAASCLNRSFQPYVRGPFGVWSETPQGGVPNFLTGAGGFLQALTAGYGGLRWEDDALRLRPRCIEGASLTRLRGLVYRGSTLLLEYDCDGSTDVGAGDGQVAVERKAVPDGKPDGKFKAGGKRPKMRVTLISRSLGAVQLGLDFTKTKGQDKQRVTVGLVPGRAVQLPLREVRIVALQPKAEE